MEDSVACNVSSALEKVPKADTWALSVVCSELSAFVWAAPYAFVSEVTMALMSSPEPMPVDVIRALPALAEEVLELPVGATELMRVWP